MSTTIKPFRPWHALWRSVFEVEHGGHLWSIDVDFFEWDKNARLYRDGQLVEYLTSPARFELPDGARIEVDLSLFGFKRLRLVDGDRETGLSPMPGTAEAWRARIARRYPNASRWIERVSWTILAIALITQGPDLLGLLGRLFGLSFSFGFSLPPVLDAVITSLGVLAAIERALSMKYDPWLDPTWDG